MRGAILRLRAERRGASSVEFAVICPVLFLLLFMILAVCLLLWTKSAMQMAASELARCSAIGSSSCSDSHAYVASKLSAWGVSGLLPTFTATVTQGATCGSPAGHFSTVIIRGDGPAWFVPTLPQTVLVAQACYPATT